MGIAEILSAVQTFLRRHVVGAVGAAVLGLLATLLRPVHLPTLGILVCLLVGSWLALRLGRPRLHEAWFKAAALLLATAAIFIAVVGPVLLSSGPVFLAVGRGAAAVSLVSADQPGEGTLVVLTDTVRRLIPISLWSRIRSVIVLPVERSGHVSFPWPAVIRFEEKGTLGITATLETASYRLPRLSLDFRNDPPPQGAKRHVKLARGKKRAPEPEQRSTAFAFGLGWGSTADISAVRMPGRDGWNTVACNAPITDSARYASLMSQALQALDHADVDRTFLKLEEALGHVPCPLEKARLEALMSLISADALAGNLGTLQAIYLANLAFHHLTAVTPEPANTVDAWTTQVLANIYAPYLSEYPTRCETLAMRTESLWRADVVSNLITRNPCHIEPIDPNLLNWPNAETRDEALVVLNQWLRDALAQRGPWAKYASESPVAHFKSWRTQEIAEMTYSAIGTRLQESPNWSVGKRVLFLQEVLTVFLLGNMFTREGAERFGPLVEVLRPSVDALPPDWKRRIDSDIENAGLILTLFSAFLSVRSEEEAKRFVERNLLPRDPGKWLTRFYLAVLDKNSRLATYKAAREEQLSRARGSWWSSTYLERFVVLFLALLETDGCMDDVSAHSSGKCRHRPPQVTTAAARQAVGDLAELSVDGAGREFLPGNALLSALIPESDTGSRPIRSRLDALLEADSKALTKRYNSLNWERMNYYSE